MVVRLPSIVIAATIACASAAATSSATGQELPWPASEHDGDDDGDAEPTPVPPSPVLTIAGAEEPPTAGFEAPAGQPAYRSELPRGTPEEQREADPAKPITGFVEALQRAYWSEPRLLAERARLRSLDFRLPQSRAQYGPELQYSANYGYLRDNFEQAAGGFSAFSGWTSTASAILSQPLITFGRLRAGEDAARAQIAFGRASLRATEQQTLFNAISIYAAVLRDRLGVEIAGDNVALLAREFSDTGERLRSRESTSTDLQQVQSRLELARAQFLSAQRAAASSDAFFLQLVGAPAGELEQPNPLRFPVQTLEDAYAYADTHNALLASAYARERVSRAQLEAARAELLPRIDLQGRASYGTVTPYSDDLRQTELRGSITLSGTLDSGVRQARIGEAAAANDADWRLIDSALRENRAELADAWNGWQTQTASIDRLFIAATAAEQALEGALLQERAGLRTTLDVLELARDLLVVRTSYNSARAASYVAKARVLATMGALESEYLFPDSEGYDAEAHFDRVEHTGDFPLLTPLVRALDSLTTSSRGDRPVRDPAGPLAIDGVKPDPMPDSTEADQPVP